ncbi:MAG: metallophosphoesterase family protein [bacterium]|nr:metallophosphoesterase family protein [bacterium]
MIFVTGDCHGNYGRFDLPWFPAQEEMDRQDYVIVCGDFGYWDQSREQEYVLKQLERKNFTILFVSGNHENFDLLADLPVQEWNGGKVQFVRENVIHLMRGQMFTLQGRKFFTFGGARSHDIQDGILEADDPELPQKVIKLNRAGALYRIRHLSWWEEEMPSLAEYQEGEQTLQKNQWTCDYIISHCAPSSAQAALSDGEFKTDELTEYFEKIKASCQYRTWYFGHYHEDMWIDEKHRALYAEILQIL